LIAGIAWVTRTPGIIFLIPLTLIYFINFKKTPATLLKYAICVGIFFLVASPMLIQKNEFYGNPLYESHGANLFSGLYAHEGNMANRVTMEYSASDFINDNGFPTFVDRFIITGLVNFIDQIVRISFPYLILFVPFGILFSFRVIDQNPKYIRANWILMLTTIAILIIPFSVIFSRRYLFYLIPFMIIFSVIPIQRVVEYGLGTFSFTNKQKNIVLIIILASVIVLATLFMFRFDLPDKSEQDERINFSKFLLDNYEGRILDAGNTLQSLRISKLTDPPDNFKTFRNINHVDPTKTVGKNYMIPINSKDSLTTIALSAESIDEFVLLSEEYDVRYFSVNKEGVADPIYSYLDEIYENDEKYPYFNKVFDSEPHGYEKFLVKVFQFNYEKYHEIKGT